MGFTIFKVVDLAGGKITAKILDSVSNPTEDTVTLGNNYKFTFIKASDLTVQTDDDHQSALVAFKYKDNF